MINMVFSCLHYSVCLTIHYLLMPYTAQQYLAQVEAPARFAIPNLAKSGPGQIWKSNSVQP